MNKFDYMEKYGYEQMIYFYDRTTGLKGITCIHDTTLGPALGGTRILNYASEEDAAIDCLRLARGMTYKSAAAGLNLGGGKTVLIGDPNTVKNEAYFRALGRFIQSLNGRYITAEDVNTNTKDMEFIAMETDAVVGLEGKSGNPSPLTALGCYHGVRAAIKTAFGDDDVAKRSFAVQGAGQTGYFLIKLLVEHGAKKIYFTEINPAHVERMKREHPDVEFVAPDKYWETDADVLCPCALGGVLNDDSIPKIRAKVIAGTANNVLLDEDRHGNMLKDKGILYAPDFVINAGGVINVFHELGHYNVENVKRECAKIYDRLVEIFKIAREQNLHTQEAAKQYAKKRIETIGRVRANFIPRAAK